MCLPSTRGQVSPVTERLPLGHLRSRGQTRSGLAVQTARGQVGHLRGLSPGHHGATMPRSCWGLCGDGKASGIAHGWARASPARPSSGPYCVALFTYQAYGKPQRIHAVSASGGQRPFLPLPRATPSRLCTPLRAPGPATQGAEIRPTCPRGLGGTLLKQTAPQPSRHPPPPPAHLLTLLSLRANDSWPCKQPLGPRGPSPFSVQRSGGSEVWSQPLPLISPTAYKSPRRYRLGLVADAKGSSPA